MTFILNLLDKLTNKQKEVTNGNEDARITSIGPNGIVFRSPSGQIGPQIAQAAAAGLPNLNLGDIQNKSSSLNMQGLIDMKPDGRIRADFRTLGGQLFEGTQKELSALRGDALISVIGQSAFRNNADGNFNQGPQTDIPNILGTSGIQTGRTTTPLNASSLKADTSSTSDLTAQLSAISKNPAEAAGFDKLRNAYLGIKSQEEKDAFMSELTAVFNSLDRTD